MGSLEGGGMGMIDMAWIVSNELPLGASPLRSKDCKACIMDERSKNEYWKPTRHGLKRHAWSIQGTEEGQFLTCMVCRKILEIPEEVYKTIPRYYF
jgi:hypothetical protein